MHGPISRVVPGKFLIDALADVVSSRMLWSPNTLTETKPRQQTTQDIHNPVTSQWCMFRPTKPIGHHLSARSVHIRGMFRRRGTIWSGATCQHAAVGCFDHPAPSVSMLPSHPWNVSTNLRHLSARSHHIHWLFRPSGAICPHTPSTPVGCFDHRALSVRTIRSHSRDVSTTGHHLFGRKLP